MDHTLVINHLRQTLARMTQDVALIFYSLSSARKHPFNLDTETLIGILTDKEGFRIKFEELHTLIAVMEKARESPGLLSRMMRNKVSEPSITLERASFDPIPRTSAGIIVSLFGNYVSIESTSPSLPRWASLRSDASYYAIVSLVQLPQTALETFAIHVYGDPLDNSKACIDVLKRLEECLLRVWCIVINDWFGVNTAPPDGESSVLSDCSLTHS